MANTRKEKEKIEETGGELTSIPNEKYQKFFNKFAEIDTLPIEQWKLAHLLGYFCRKYKETYQMEYPWKFNNANPNKCFEVWQMNTLVAKLSANPKILKDYIDWSYQNIASQAKRRLTSISFMTRDEVVNPYKMNILLGGKKCLNVDRSTPLPTNYIEIIDRCALPKLTTYGDLSFLSQMDPMPLDISILFQALQEVGFDMKILKRIV
jgi:hypothetical protein